MRTIIKITEQEAIDAWKENNSHLLNGENTVVEIEENKTTTSATGTNILPINPYPYQGGIINC